MMVQKVNHFKERCFIFKVTILFIQDQADFADNISSLIDGRESKYVLI